MKNRTDLAVESFEAHNKTYIDGVKVREENGVTVVSVLNKNGEKAIGKPMGKYITCTVKPFENGVDLFGGRLERVSDILASLVPKNAKSALVAGIGNLDITADALGPKTNNYVLATRHIAGSDGVFKDFFSVSSISTGVLGDTGIESAEIIKGVASAVKPDFVIAVDALAASSSDRLGTTVQMSDTGIAPGSGVGNHRYEISQNTLGVPVISIGIPTVVSTQVIAAATQEKPMLVTPGEIDRITELGARLIGMSINITLQKNINRRDLFSLVF